MTYQLQTQPVQQRAEPKARGLCGSPAAPSRPAPFPGSARPPVATGPQRSRARLGPAPGPATASLLLIFLLSPPNTKGRSAAPRFSTPPGCAARPAEPKPEEGAWLLVLSPHRPRACPHEGGQLRDPLRRVSAQSQGVHPWRVFLSHYCSQQNLVGIHIHP